MADTYGSFNAIIKHKIMTQLAKRRNRDGGLFPTRRNELLGSFFTPSLLDFDDTFFHDDFSAPPANITETDKDFLLELSVPGMKKDDFSINIDNGLLTISSEKEEEKNDEGKNYKRREFSYSSFSRSFTLPDNVDENNISAKYDNGMLQVTLPKKDGTASNPKKEIPVS